MIAERDDGASHGEPWRWKVGSGGSWRGCGQGKIMTTGTQRGVWGRASWLEPRGAGRAAVGEEAGNEVDIGIMEGPEYQVRSLGFLRQTAGGLLPRAGAQLQRVAVGQNGGRRQENPWGSPGWLLGTDSRGESCAL